MSKYKITGISYVHIGKRERWRDRETDRETDKKTDRQTDGERQRQRQRQSLTLNSETIQTKNKNKNKTKIPAVSGLCLFCIQVVQNYTRLFIRRLYYRAETADRNTANGIENRTSHSDFLPCRSLHCALYRRALSQIP